MVHNAIITAIKCQLPKLLRLHQWAITPMRLLYNIER